MNKIIHINLPLTGFENNSFCAFIVPFDVKKVFGKGRVKVKLTIDENYEHRGLLTRMSKTEPHFIGIRKQVREEADLEIGKTYALKIEEDTEPRIVEVPEEMKKVWSENGVWETFQQLSYTHQKEYVQHITEAKKAETRVRRLKKSIDMLKEKRR